MTDKRLNIDLGGLQLRNPTILAAGILGLTGASLLRVWNSGTGAVITKTVGRNPREGHPGPRILGASCGLINAMGLPNPGIEEITEEIKIVKDHNSVVIGSVFGKDPEDYSFLVSEMNRAKVDAVELNLSCPHAEGLSTIGQNPDLTGDIIETSKKESDVPLWAKLPSNTNITNLLDVAKSAESAGVDAVVLMNTIPAMAIDANSEKPILGNVTGGLSGPAVKPLGLRIVYEAYKEVSIPIIGSGGVLSGEDLIEYILAGASAVEIGTGILERDLDIFDRVCEEALEYLKDRKIKDLVGKIHSD